MAKAYKCDVCGKLVENCYKISGLDIFLNRLMDSRINEEKHIEISDCCKDCYEKNSYNGQKNMERKSSNYRIIGGCFYFGEIEAVQM